MNQRAKFDEYIPADICRSFPPDSDYPPDAKPKVQEARDAKISDKEKSESIARIFELMLRCIKQNQQEIDNLKVVVSRMERTPFLDSVEQQVLNMERW